MNLLEHIKQCMVLNRNNCSVLQVHQETQKMIFSISALKRKKMNLAYSEEMTKPTEIDMTAIENLGNHTVKGIFELLFPQDILQDIIAIIDQNTEYAKPNNNNEFTLTSNELKIFIGIILITGYRTEPQEDVLGTCSKRWCSPSE